MYFAKFAYNNSIYSSTRVTPFYAYTCHHPHWCVLETPGLPTNPNAENHLERLRKIQAELSTHLHQAQQTQKNYADRHRFHPFFILEIVYGYYDDT